MAVSITSYSVEGLRPVSEYLLSLPLKTTYRKETNLILDLISNSAVSPNFRDVMADSFQKCQILLFYNLFVQTKQKIYTVLSAVLLLKQLQLSDKLT